MNKISQNLAGMNVLVVDDMPENIDVLREPLEREGLNISVALGAEKALEVVMRRTPDLILLDTIMPGKDGFETCRELKKLTALKNVPVIFISTKVELEDIKKIFSSGGEDYIIKPFRHEEVSARVRTHLELLKVKRDNQVLTEKIKNFEGKS